MQTLNKTPLIEDATCLLPCVIADRVIAEVEGLLKQELPDRDGYNKKLCDKAQIVVDHNANFRAKIFSKAGNRGRDTLWKFMRHWLAGMMWKENRALFEKLPNGFGWNC